MNLIACALCETWKSAFSSHPLHQPLFCSSCSDGDRGNSLAPEAKTKATESLWMPLWQDQARMSTQETLRQCFAGARGGGKKGKTVLGLAHSLKGSPSLPRVRPEAEGWRETQGVPLQFCLSYFSLSITLMGLRRTAHCTSP